MALGRGFLGAFRGYRFAYLVVALILSSNATAWEITRDFNRGAIGSVAIGADAFDDAANRSYYDASTFAEGGQAARLNINAGEEGWGDWGGVINFPQDLGAGREFWYQMHIHIPTDFEIIDSNGSLKMIRFHGRRTDGSNGGYLDIQLNDDGKGDAAFRMIREGSTETGWLLSGSKRQFRKGEWHKITVQLVSDTVPKDSGGRSFVKIWLNGDLIANETGIRTLVTSGEVLESLYLFTYWNGGSPKSQHLWVDNIQMSTERPSWADGLSDENSTPVPVAPSALQVH